MWVKILRDTVADGKTVKTGEILEIGDRDANTLLLLGKAERHSGDEYKTVAETPAPEIEPEEAPAPESELETLGEDDFDLKDPDLAIEEEAAPKVEKTAKKETKKNGKKK